LKKIKDRILLGAIAGLGANTVKTALGLTLMKKGWAEINGIHRAAGMLVPPHKIADPKGRMVGILADNVIAGILGVCSVYILSVTGKNNAVIKGTLTGQAMWTSLYGVLGTLGATKINPVSPDTVISEFVEHSVYGGVANIIATKLGDPGLFDGTIPLKPSSQQGIPQSQSYAKNIR